MKKLILSLLVVGTVLTSCKKTEDPAPVAVLGSGEITGTISTNKTFTKGNYTLKGIVKVAAGTTLTFDAGSTITADKVTGDNALVVLNGGKLIINGTASEPVVFTEKSQTPGSWGGIIMYGDAPINGAGGLKTLLSEDGNNLNYGGTNAVHNGGELHYVRVEYAGSKLGDGQKENNSFTFYSCGTGTKLDHLVAYKGADDGYEFFGGTVSATDLVAYGNYDDSFDWQDGWQGQDNKNWYAYQVSKGNYGMEIESSSNDNAFFPKVTDITLKRAADTKPEVVGDVQVDAFQFKKEGNGTYNNIIVDGYLDYKEGTPEVLYPASVLKIQDAQTNDHQVKTEKIKLTNVKSLNTSNDFKAPNGAAFVVTLTPTQFTKATAATGAVITPGAWTTVGTENLIK